MGISFGRGIEKIIPKKGSTADTRVLRTLITFYIINQDNSNDKFDAKAGYCYTLELHNLMPTEVSDTVSPNFDSQDIPGRSAPVASYNNNGARVVSFTLELHRDFNNLGAKEDVASEHFEHIIQTFKSMNYPTYTNSGVKPPHVYCALGCEEYPTKNLSIFGYATIGVTYKCPIDKWGRFMQATISVQITETPQISFDAVEIRNNSYVLGKSSTHRANHYKYPRTKAENDANRKKTTTKKKTSSSGSKSSSKKSSSSSKAVSYIVSTTAIKKGGHLNVRKGAGTNYAIIGKLNRGARFSVVQTKKVNGVTWGKTTSGGWVNLKYAIKEASASLSMVSSRTTTPGSVGSYMSEIF